METIILHPKNKTQLSILKNLAKEMGMLFETKKEEESPYSSEFVESILQGDEDYKNGKSVKIALEDLWK